MPLNIKNRDVEKLATEVAAITGETKTEAIRKALQERKERLAFRIARRDRRKSLLRFMEREVWSRIPREALGRALAREEEDRILGYGPEGV